MANVLPDSRVSQDKRESFFFEGKWYVPVYCINCGIKQGAVPEVLITHVAALCDTGKGCQKYGAEAMALLDPDAPHREALAFETAKLTSKLGRPVTLAELEAIANESSTSPIAAIARDWQRTVSRET